MSIVLALSLSLQEEARILFEHSFHQFSRLSDLNSKVYVLTGKKTLSTFGYSQGISGAMQNGKTRVIISELLDGKLHYH